MIQFRCPVCNRDYGSLNQAQNCAVDCLKKPAPRAIDRELIEKVVVSTWTKIYEHELEITPGVEGVVGSYNLPALITIVTKEIEEGKI